MRQLETVSGWQCTKGAGEHTVKGSSGTYTVFISSNEQTPHTCTCPHFVKRNLASRFETCKHIDRVLAEEVCGWNSVIDGSSPAECLNKWHVLAEGLIDAGYCPVCGSVGKVCPRCGSLLEGVRVAI